MASLGDIVIGLSMDNSQFQRTAQNSRGTLSQLGQSAMGTVGQIAGMLGAGSALAAVGFGVKLAADAEQTRISFEVMLGSAEKAKVMLSDLKAYADKSPFSGADTNEFALQLTNYGIAGDKILPTIRMLGDVAAGNKEKFAGLARAFGQMSSTGRLMGQDLNQFINAGFNPLQEIAAKTGESMTNLKKRMDDGGIASNEVEEAFRRATSEGGRFFGMTERQSKTLAGQWSTFRDGLDTTLRDIGASIAENLDLKGVLQSTSAWLQFSSSLAQRYGADLLLLTSVIGGLVAGIAVARAGMWAYSAVQSILIAKELALKAIMGPAAWLQVAAGLAAAAAAGSYLSASFAKAHEEAKKTSGEIGELKKNANSLGETGKAGGSEIDQLSQLQKKLKIIQQLKAEGSFRPEVANKEASTLVAKTDIKGLLKLDGIGDTATKANARVELLRQSLLSLNDMRGLLPADQIESLATRINAAIERETSDHSGLTKVMAEQREELNKLTMGEDAYEASKLRSLGATDAKLKELQVIKDQITALKEKKKAEEDLAEKKQREDGQLKDVAERLKESVTTKTEAFTKKKKEIDNLHSKGLIDDQTRDRAIAKAKEEFQQKDDPKKGKQTSENKAVLVGSSEAAQQLLNGVFGTHKDTFAVAKQQLAEQKATTKAIVAKNNTGPKFVVLNI